MNFYNGSKNEYIIKEQSLLISSSSSFSKKFNLFIIPLFSSISLYKLFFSLYLSIP